MARKENWNRTSNLTRFSWTSKMQVCVRTAQTSTGGRQTERQTELKVPREAKKKKP